MVSSRVNCSAYSVIFADVKIFVSLLHYSEVFPPEFLRKLEDRISELMEDFGPGEPLAGRQNYEILSMDLKFQIQSINMFYFR